MPWGLIAAAALLPVLVSLVRLGRWHPDEVYQFLEPAFFQAHGFWVRTWEWDVGLRNWAVPLLLSGFLRGAQHLGIDHPVAARAVLGLPVLALLLAMMASAHRFLRRQVSPEPPRAASIALLLFAFQAPILLFAGRTMGESISAALLVIALERLERPGPDGRNGSWAGALLGLAVVARYGSAVFVVVAVAWLGGARRWRRLGWTCLSGAAVALLLGALDWATWGRPFHSLRAYLEFNVLSGRAAEVFGAQPAWSYAWALAAWLPLWAWPGLWQLVVRERRWPLPLVAALPYLSVLLATPHKENRFLYPGLVLVALAAAPGVARLLAGLATSRARLVAVALALLVGSVAWTGPERPTAGRDFRALARLGHDPATTGILDARTMWSSSGYFCVGRDIPLHHEDRPEAFSRILGDPRVNRAIARASASAELQRLGFAVVERSGDLDVLARP